MEKRISDALITKLNNASNIVVLTGAGMSAESGIPTFRDKNGLWDKYKPEELANLKAFEKNPSLVWEWYQWRQKLVLDTQPNAGHYALSELEKMFLANGKNFSIITQNVDSLHKKAGSKNVYELHGNLMKNTCTNCTYTLIISEVDENKTIPLCPKCKQIMRPGIVWFGESLPEYELLKSSELVDTCDFFFSIGTSSVVQPAASLAIQAVENGAYVVEINTERSANANFMSEVIIGKCGEVLPEILHLLKNLEKPKPFTINSLFDFVQSI